jgi:phosphoglucosamine mutase
MKIVIDCANGAAYKVGAARARRPRRRDRADRLLAERPQHQRRLRLDAARLLQLTVPGVRAHVGIALDGDGDRLVMVDHLGRIVDGDQLLYVIAKRSAGGEASLGGPVVGTVMSNLGLEHALRELGIEFRRAAVGDRYVLAMLRAKPAARVGGETSGHLLCLDHTTTGDGLIAALQVLAIMKQTGRTAGRTRRRDAAVSAAAAERPRVEAHRSRRRSLRSSTPSRTPSGGSRAAGVSCCAPRAPSPSSG